MRIQHLAKIIGVTTSEIEKFFLSDYPQEDFTVNKKLNDTQLNAILHHFGKNLNDLNEVVDDNESTAQDKARIDEQIIDSEFDTKGNLSSKPEEFNTEIQKLTTQNISIEPKIEIIETAETTLHIENGVIKASKVALKGLVIKGKIDLPETKKTIIPVSESSSESIIEKEKKEAKVIPVYQSIEKKQPVVTKKQPSSSLSNTKNKAETAAIKKAKEDQLFQERLTKKKNLIEEKKKAHYAKIKTQQQQKVVKQTKKVVEDKTITEPNSKSTLQNKAISPDIKPQGFWQKFKYWLNGGN